MRLALAGSCVLLLWANPGFAQAAARDADPHQILWQRSLPDALALAKATGKPLLVALNMDGESASERIVREMYRDPEFVALTRRCVCVIASVFRHSPRDYDEHGRRIPCPRLGEVTCGEHMVLEPVLFDAYLSDGERVAPRHAVILPNGVKAWDHALLFDLRDVERRLAGSVLDETRAGGEAAVETSVPPPPQSAADWSALAERRDQRGRAAFEDAVATTMDEATLTVALDALAKHGDAGALPALRIPCARLWELSPELKQGLMATVHALSLETEVAQVLREQWVALSPTDDDRQRDAAAAAALPMLAALDPHAAETRSLLLGALALARDHDAAIHAVEIAFAADAKAIGAALAAHGGPCHLAAALSAAAVITAGHAEPLPRPGPSSDAMPTADELETTLEHIDRELRDRPDDPVLHARLGKASLDLARRRIEAGDSGAELLLEDAERGLARALEARPESVGWWIERARTAYFAGRFADEAAFGMRALQAAGEGDHPGLPAEVELARDRTVLDDGNLIEALRWIGDGHARLLAQRAGQDPAVELAGMVDGLRALALVAASPFADATDWLSLSSFCGAIGLRSDELTVLIHAVQRLPSDASLRQELNRVLWQGGHIERAPWIAEAVVGGADTQWHAGYAWMLAAEDRRRRQRPAEAVDAYHRAMRRFLLCTKDYPDSAARYTALAWLGAGMAYCLTEDRGTAADCLVEAVAKGQDLTAATDGLGRDVYDLVDQILEWRESGPTPVDPIGLLDRLEEAGADVAFWGTAVSDSELREGLRADGRNPDRVERKTVDAAGKPIRMPMGLPTAEGDAYLRASITAAQRAVEAEARGAHPAPVEDETSPRHALAQADTTWAERMLQRDRLDGVREALAEAAPLLGLKPPADDDGPDALAAVAADLRGVLGEARPRLRPGR